MQNNFYNNLKPNAWWRHWGAVLILAIIASAIIWSMLHLGSWIKAWQDQRSASAVQKQLEKAYRQDKYGGKTPEETFSLFISALRDGDVTLASKYFVLDRQEEWLKALTEYKSSQLLNDFANELSNIGQKWQRTNSDSENLSSFEYRITTKDKKTDYVSKTVFEKYPTGVWKINSL